MNCVLFAKFSVKKQNIKNILEKLYKKKIKKNTGKVREFCQSGKVVNMCHSTATIICSK